MDIDYTSCALGIGIGLIMSGIMMPLIDYTISFIRNKGGQAE